MTERKRLAGILAVDRRGYRLRVDDGMCWRLRTPDDLTRLVGRRVIADGTFATPTLLAVDYVGAATC